MPQRDEGRERKITYYQWVPIILMLQAGMFLAPYALWRMLSSRSGIDLAAIVSASCSSQESASPEERQKMLRFATTCSQCKNLRLYDTGDYSFFIHSVLHWSVVVSTICRHSSRVVAFRQTVARPKFRGPRSASIARRQVLVSSSRAVG